VSVVTTVEATGGGPALRILIVDNRPDRRDVMRHLVAATGTAAPDIAEAGSAAEATALIDGDGCDVVVVEIQLPVAVGLETIAALRSHRPDSKIVVCSFHREEATKARAQAQGADAYLDKPVSTLALQEVLRGFATELRPERSSGTKGGQTDRLERQR
jgi:CheY-like chemotaxis protein